MSAPVRPGPAAPAAAPASGGAAAAPAAVAGGGRGRPPAAAAGQAAASPVLAARAAAAAARGAPPRHRSASQATSPGQALVVAAAFGVAGVLTGSRRATRRGSRLSRHPRRNRPSSLAATVVPASVLYRGRSTRDVVGRSAAGAPVVEVETPSVGASSAPAEAAVPPGRPLQIVKIDLESNNVIVGDEEIRELEAALKRSGAEKVAVVAVMGAFRTGKSFMLDLMLRYMREKAPKVVGGALPVEDEDCEVPPWALEKNVPDWVVKCGDSLVEGREGQAQGDLDGFQWRPGMDKCTEGIWIWSEAFVCKAGGEDVAVLLMDTQGAWDARMSKEQSATVFGLTTLLASRLIYNVSKQIQQDKIDNLLYFTEFAQAALRTKAGKVFETAEGKMQPFQTLEFLVRDWPHYEDGSSVELGRKMMVSHLGQYMDPKVSEDTQSIDTLQRMFKKIDVWCLPHPSLAIEREAWNGDLEVIDSQFWRFVDSYLQKIFGPEELAAKTTMGTPITVDTFSTVLREFIVAFQDAAPQAQTFAEAMETSTSLLARDSAMRLLRKTMIEESSSKPEALAPEDFERVATETAMQVEAEFESKAIYGSEDGIRKVSQALKTEVKEEMARYRDENTRKLEASLNSLTNISLAALAGFGLDRVSDFTCDWWSGFCRDISNDLAIGYTGVLFFVLYSLTKIQSQRGELDAAVAALELGKSMTKKAKSLYEENKDKLPSSSPSSPSPPSSDS